MIGYGCGVSQYPQFYDQYLEKYQVLPRLYFGTSENPKRKMGVRFGRSIRNIFLGVYFDERQLN